MGHVFSSNNSGRIITGQKQTRLRKLVYISKNYEGEKGHLYQKMIEVPRQPKKTSMQSGKPGLWKIPRPEHRE